MKKYFGFILISLVLILLVLFLLWKNLSLPADKNNAQEKIFVIPPGLGMSQISEKLKEEGLIKSNPAFQALVVSKGMTTDLQAGDYRLSPSMNLEEVIEALSHGTLDIWVTIPEGLRKEEIGKILKESFAKQGVSFDVQEFLAQARTLEGYLFPDTYLFPKDSSPQDTVIILNNTFKAKYDSLNINSNLSQKNSLILASLVEREVKQDEDRAIVAGILLKRLNNDWPLQIDASVQYAKANLECPANDITCKWWPIVYPEDLENISSGYNTYKNQGLPPAPICNPGLASLKAVLNPQSSDYWFYLSDNKGKIHYSKTIEEHQKNISQYLD